MTEKRDVMLAGAIYGLKGYCSATPQPTHPNTDPYELLGAWNRWNERLQDHYIPELLKAFEK